MTLMAENTLQELAAAFLEDLADADTVLQSVARSYPGASSRANKILSHGNGSRPSEKELAQWINEGDCPTDAVNAACGRMTALLGCDVLPPLKMLGGIVFARDVVISFDDLWSTYRKAVDGGGKVRWPLAPLVNAWQNPPRPVEPSRRTTARVIPARLAMADGGGSRNSRLLFSPAAHTDYGPDGEQMVMPGFAKPDTPSPALPLALYELGAGPAISPGKGAPLALRMFVESVLCVPMDERERGLPVAMSVSLREFLKWLYPTRTPSPAEYWPRLMAAVEALDSWDARIPLYDPQTKRNELRRVVSVSGIPRGPGALDESVRIIVDLPPGSGNGPQVSDNLRLWGVKSAPAYRLLINLAYQWHNPGVTKIPLGKGKARHWVQVDDPDRYPLISEAELVALTFPTTRRHRGRRSAEALTVAKQLEKAGELRFVEGKILPPIVTIDRRLSDQIPSLA